MSRDQADRVTAGNGGFNVHVFKNVQEENFKLRTCLSRPSVRGRGSASG